jgi:monothiol glutaredoxin
VQFNDSARQVVLDLSGIAGLPDNGGFESMDVNERIKQQLESHPVLLYMKGTPDFPQCGFSAKTVSVLRAVGAKFAYINIFEDPEIREGLKRYSNWPTYPQLYVNGELIGGCDIAVELYQSGELQQMIESAGATQAQ